MRKRENKLSSSYYDVRGVGSYGGVSALSRKTKIKPEGVKKWLESQDVYTLHKPVRYKFLRRKVIVAGPNQQWQADLVDVSRLSRHNQDNKFLLTCIDVFSKKAWVVPLKDKMGSSLLKAFQSIDHPLPKTNRQGDWIYQSEIPEMVEWERDPILYVRKWRHQTFHRGTFQSKFEIKVVVLFHSSWHVDLCGHLGFCCRCLQSHPTPKYRYGPWWCHFWKQSLGLVASVCWPRSI